MTEDENAAGSPGKPDYPWLPGASRRLIDDLARYLHVAAHAQARPPRDVLWRAQQCALYLEQMQCDRRDMESMRSDLAQARRDVAAIHGSWERAAFRLGAVLDLAEERGMNITDADIDRFIAARQREWRAAQDAKEAARQARMGATS